MPPFRLLREPCNDKGTYLYVCAGVLASFQSWPAVFAVAILHWAVGGAIYWRWASAEKVI